MVIENKNKSREIKKQSQHTQRDENDSGERKFGTIRVEMEKCFHFDGQKECRWFQGHALCIC